MTTYVVILTRAAFATANTKMPQRSLNDLEI